MSAKLGSPSRLIEDAEPLVPELRSFLNLITLLAIILICVWSMLMYACVCLPNKIWLQVIVSTLFLVVPIGFFALHLFHGDIESARWPLQRLQSKRFIAFKWIEHFLFVVGMLVSIALVSYLLIRTLLAFGLFPRTVYLWIVHRVTMILGFSIGSGIDGSIQSWITGFFYFVTAVTYTVDLVLLITGLTLLSRAFAIGDLMVLDNLFSSLLYGRWSRFLAGAFTLVVILSVAGAIHKTVEGIKELFGGGVHNWELDLLLVGLRRLGGWAAKYGAGWMVTLHIPLLLLLVRVVFPRLIWVRSLARSLWSPQYASLGCVILAIPLFFGAESQPLAVSHFYDGYRLGAEALFGIFYSLQLLLGFVLLLRGRTGERL